MIGGRLKASPPGLLPLDLKAAIRSCAEEIKAAIATAPSDPSEPEAPLPSPLVLIADAIAAVPRSPFLNDIALSRAAAAYVTAERAAEAAPSVLRSEIRYITAAAMSGAAREIRRSNYEAAYDALESLVRKVGELTAQ